MLCKAVSSFVVVIVAIVVASFLNGRAQEKSLNTCSLVEELFGSECLEHDVLTRDGYYISLKRIPAEKNSRDRLGEGKPVLLLHGLADSSATFVLSGREHSFAGSLLDNGYEVWMLDKRGRIPYKHERIEEGDHSFWDFSIDEMVDFDIPDAVSYVKNFTGSNLVAIVGHSQGGLLAALTLSMHLDTAKSVQSLVAFGSPIGSWGNRHPFPLLPNFVVDNVHPGRLFGFARTVSGGFCSALPSLCPNLICFSAGCGSSSNINPAVAVRALQYYPREASMKNLQHLIQFDKSGFLHRYDHGPDVNVVKYSQESPPKFLLERLETPTALFYGANDKFIPQNGLQDSVEVLPEGVVRVANGTLPYGHAEFIWGLDAKDLLYPSVFEFWKDLSST